MSVDHIPSKERAGICPFYKDGIHRVENYVGGYRCRCQPRKVDETSSNPCNSFVGDGPTYSCLLCGRPGTEHPAHDEGRLAFEKWFAQTFLQGAPQGSVLLAWRAGAAWALGNKPHGNETTEHYPTAAHVMCTCGKRFGEHPIQPPWWPCMVRAELKANVRAPEVCGCPYGQCHCDDGSENGSPR